MNIKKHIRDIFFSLFIAILFSTQASGSSLTNEQLEMLGLNKPTVELLLSCNGTLTTSVATNPSSTKPFHISLVVTNKYVIDDEMKTDCLTFTETQIKCKVLTFPSSSSEQTREYFIDRISGKTTYTKISFFNQTSFDQRFLGFCKRVERAF